MVNLSTKAKELFRDRISRLSDADLQNHPKVVAFKDGIQNSSSRGNGTEQQADFRTIALLEEASSNILPPMLWKLIGTVFSGNQNAEENTDEMDDEITVTQTQVNLTCPLTKVRLSSPLNHF